MKNACERIYRIWSEAREEHVAVRIQFAVEQLGTCRVVRLGERDEWL